MNAPRDWTLLCLSCGAVVAFFTTFSLVHQCTVYRGTWAENTPVPRCLGAQTHHCTQNPVSHPENLLIHQKSENSYSIRKVGYDQKSSWEKFRKSQKISTKRIFRFSKTLGTGYWVLGTGYWVLGTGYWVLGTGYWVLGTGYWVLGTGYWVLGTGYWVLGTGYWVLGTGYWVLGTGYWVLGTGYWVLGTGYWVLGTGYWVLGTGYWVLGTGYWVLGTGYWVLGTGYWVLGTGYWVLGTGYWVLGTQRKHLKSSEGAGYGEDKVCNYV